MHISHELIEIKHDIDKEIEEGKDPSTIKIRREYQLLAERNKGLLLTFSQKTFRLLAALTVIILICGIVSIHSSKQSGSLENKTCEIQNLGLKAQYHLTNVMQDVAILLTPLSGAPSTPTPAQLIKPFVNLRKELRAYVVFENSRPQSRTC
jgi:hypothetical protein